MSKQAPVFEPDISGYLQLKRKMFWVIRYAEIVNGYFYYYYNKGDSKPRGVFTLYGSKSNELLTSDNDQVIQFTSCKAQQNKRLLLRCDNNQLHRNWLHKLNVFSQIPTQQNYSATLSSRNTAQVDIASSTLSYMTQNTTNNQFNSDNQAITDSVFNIESSQQLKGNGANKLNESRRQNDVNNQAQNIQYIPVQYDSCKANPYIFDNEFLTDKQGGTGSVQRKNLLTALDHFKDCKILSDIDKNIRLYCSEVAIDSNYSQDGSVRSSNSSNSSSESTGVLSKLISQYFDSTQMMIAMAFVAIMLGLILYQGLQILNTTNLLITVLIVINLILVPLFAQKLNQMSYNNQKKKMKQIKQGVIAEYYLPHNVNEILFALTKHFDKRKEWQLNVQKCEPKPLLASEYVTTYYRGEPEVFLQHVIRDRDTIYLTEESTNHNYIRIFSMPANSQYEEGTTVKYYFYSPFTKIADMNNNPNSPLLLYGINFYLKQLKRNPLSALYTYYSQHYGYSQNSSQNFQPSSSISISQSTNKKSIQNDSTATSNTNIQNIQEKNTLENSTAKSVQEKNNAQQQQQQQQQTVPKKQAEPQQEEEEQKVDTLVTPVSTNSSAAVTDSDLKLLDGENGVKYNGKIKDLLAYMKQQVTLDPSNNWKQNENKPDYKTHTKIDEATGNVMSRGEVVIKKSPQVIVDYIQDASKRKTWDEMFKEGKEVASLSENCRVEHNVFKGIFPVSDRDFCLLQISLKDGNVNYLLATSVEHPSVPEVKKPVRASLKIGGWVIEPISATESKCVYLTCSNLNGSIPQAIKDKVAKDQSSNALKLKKSMEKN